MLIYLRKFHFKDGIKWIPRYLYDSFWCNIGINLLLYAILYVWMYALNISGIILDFFGTPVMAYLEILRSIPAHVLNFWILFICSFTAFTLFVIDAKLFAYAAALSWVLKVWNTYPIWSLCNHCNSDLRNNMNKYGLRVSPYIVPLWMCIGLVLSKNFPTYILVEFCGVDRVS